MSNHVRAWWSRLRAASSRLGGLSPIVAYLDGRFWRGLSPAILPLALLPFIAEMIRVALREPLFSDQLVHQYMGWCLLHGLRLYRDFGMADGPFPEFLHAAIQIFAGYGDRAFRKADFVLQIAGSGAIGAMLAPGTDPRRVARGLHRLAWGLAAAAVWLSWYAQFDWQGMTQREAFYGLFGSVGMVLLYASSGYRERGARIATVLGALLVATQAFGKPTGILYTGAGLVGVLLPDATATLDRWRRVRLFFIGVGGCLFLFVLAMAFAGSFSGYIRYSIEIPYAGNLFLFRMDWQKLVLTTYWDRFIRVLVCAVIADVAAVGAGLLPARALAFALVPPLAFLGACLQGRGYDYHVIPTVASVHVVLLLMLAGLWRGLDEPDQHVGDGAKQSSVRRRWEGAPAAAALAFAFVGFYCIESLQESHLRWSGDPKKWDVPEHTSADEEKKVGQYIKAHSKPNDWVFAYNPTNAHVVLLTAERRSASPFIHAYWLDPLSLLGQSEVKPNATQRKALEAMQTENRRIACDAVVEHQPAVMAFDDVREAEAICPAVHDMLARDFDEGTQVATFRVYLRRAKRPDAH